MTNATGRARLILAAVLAASAMWQGLRADVWQQASSFSAATTKDEMTERANSFFRTLYDEEFIDTLLVFSAATPADTIRSQVWYWTAEYSISEERYADARTYAAKALPLLMNGSDHVGYSDCLNVLSVVNIRLSNYVAAIDYAKRCYEQDRLSGDTIRQSMSLNLLAAICMKMRQPEEAEQYVLRALGLLGDSDDSRRSVLLGMLSEVYNSAGNNARALECAEEAYAIEQRLGREHKAMIRLAQKGAALVGLARYEEAISVLSTAISFFEQNDERQSLGISYNKLGQALYALDRKREAADYFRKGAAIFADIGDLSNEMHSRRGIYESLWTLNPDSARIELDRFNVLKDSLFQLGTAESLARYNAEFGADSLRRLNVEHEQRAGQLRQETDAQRQAKRHAIISGVCVALLLLFFAVLLWWAMRRRQRREEALNRRLNNSIDELREKYSELSARYSEALRAAAGCDDQDCDDMTDADREFVRHAMDTANSLIASGNPDAESLAAALNMSLYQLRQRLTSVTGQTPQTFLFTLRMERARYLFDNRPDLNVSEVAMQCAYGDTPAFTRAFKKAFGMTPSQYIESNRK